MPKFVFFKGEKYDIEDFIKNHPGGSVINNAIDKNLEEVWKEYGVSWHLNNSRVMETLQKYKVENTTQNFSNYKNNELRKSNNNYGLFFDLFILILVIFIFVNNSN